MDNNYLSSEIMICSIKIQYACTCSLLIIIWYFALEHNCQLSTLGFGKINYQDTGRSQNFCWIKWWEDDTGSLSMDLLVVTLVLFKLVCQLTLLWFHFNITYVYQFIMCHLDHTQRVCVSVRSFFLFSGCCVSATSYQVLRIRIITKT